MVERCYRLSRTVVNPIIDWTDEDVWEFIRENNVRYCCLYDQGHKRLGCVGCPMSTRQAEELENNPKYKQAYIRAFDRMLEKLTDKNRCQWRTGEEVFQWWTGWNK